MAKKYHRPTPPKPKTNIISIPVMNTPPMGHLTFPKAGPHEHRNNKRLKTRQTQLRQALKDW